jgi:hypothetical protein
MERSFTFEAKTFCFSAKDGCPLFRLEERRKGFAGFILVSNQCASWLMDTVEEAVLSQAKEEIAKSYREGDKVTMVHGGGNKAGIFLEVSVFAEGGRKGVIWLPEGRYGRGWRRFAGELRQLVVGTIKKTEPAESLLDAPPSGSKSGRSYLEVLRSTSGVEAKASGLKVVSPSPLDLLPALYGFELGYVGELRSAVDCYELESLSWSLAAESASSCSKKTKDNIGISGLMRNLGLLHDKLDRVLAGLGSKFVGPYEIVDSSTILDGPQSRSDPGMNLILDTGLVKELVLGTDQGMNLDSDLDWALDVGRASDPGMSLSLSHILPDSVGAMDTLEFEVEGKDDPAAPLSVGVSAGIMLAAEVPAFLEGGSPASDPAPSSGESNLATVTDMGLQVSETRLGSPEVVLWVSERALDGGSGFGGEGRSIPESSLQAVGLELSLVPVDASFVGLSAVEGYASVAEPTPLMVILAEESDLSISVVASLEAGAGSSNMPGPGFSVPFDRNHPPVSSATQLRLGAAKLSDPRLASDPIIMEAFALPWEVDSPDSEGEDFDSGVADHDIELVSEVCSAKDVRDPPQDKTARTPSPALGLIKRGFLGPRAAHPAPVKVDKKPAQVRSDSPSQPVVEGSDSEAVLGRGISQPSHVTSSVAKSQRGYAQRVKEKVAKQPNKNKELLAEIVVDVPVVGEEGYSIRVLEAMKCAPVVGMSWGGDDKKLLDTFSAMENKEPKVKGLRELKNLDCSMSPVKCQHRRGVGGSKYVRSFPPEIH